MYSLATEPLSGVIHDRNGDNMADVVAKLAEKIDMEKVEEYGEVQSLLHSWSAHNYGHCMWYHTQYGIAY